MKTFIITGIQMRNKGSQAMFLSLGYALKSIYNDCEVIGFANKYDSPEQYAFTLMPYDEYTRFVLKYGLCRVPFLVPFLTRLVALRRKSNKWNGKLPEMRKALLRADAIFDASGYTLGSGWPKPSGRVLLDTIKLAKQFKRKIILMPQSFGPFDWGESDDSDFRAEILKELAYPMMIYAREREGYECLTSLGLPNVELSADMVIREKGFPSAREILVDYRDDEKSYPTRGSVGFIINKNVFRVGDATSVTDLYARLLEQLLEAGEKVYIVNTSTADIELVRALLQKVKDSQNINIIDGEYSSPELIEIISRFKFMVASRYHSVVFAYRCGVPTVILGWAVKYSDLAALFQQQDYVFDIRRPDAERILEGVNRMRKNHDDEARRIKESLEIVQATSVVRQAVKSLG